MQLILPKPQPAPPERSRENRHIRHSPNPFGARPALASRLADSISGERIVARDSVAGVRQWPDSLVTTGHSHDSVAGYHVLTTGNCSLPTEFGLKLTNPGEGCLQLEFLVGQPALEVHDSAPDLAAGPEFHRIEWLDEEFIRLPHREWSAHPPSGLRP